jgi:4-amino-4-deoxy-L-arabinose transferase-like glycosyltransferase
MDRIGRIITFDRFLFMFIVLGVALRVIAVLFDTPRFDGAFYSTLGFNLIDQGDYVTLSGLKTYNFSLTYPAYLAMFYGLIGYSIGVTQVASYICSLLAILITYLTTKNLFDHRAGLIAAAVISLTSALIVVTGKNYVENIVLVFFVPTIWAMIKGLKDSRYIPVAAFFAGLTYYTKTDVGLYVALGGLGAFAIWRFTYMRWLMLKDKYYWLAFLIVVVMVVGRAFLISAGQIPAQNITSTLSSSFDVQVFLYQIVLHGLLVGAFFIFWYPEFRSSLSRYREDRINLILLLATGLTLLAVLNATGWGLLNSKVLGGVSREYITIVYIPAMWLFFWFKSQNDTEETKGILESIKEIFSEYKRLVLFLAFLGLGALMILVDDWMAILYFFGALCFVFTGFRKRVTILLIASLIVSANAVSAVYRPAYVDAAERINMTLQGGQTVALDRENESVYLSPDRIFPYFSRHDISLEIYANGTTPDYIISEKDITYAGYCEKGIFEGVSKPTLLRLAKDWILGRGIPQSFPEKTIYTWSHC